MKLPWMQKFDVNSFRSENWAKLSDSFRRAQMQGLENSMAKLQGRPPRKVIIDSTISNGGAYTPDGKGGGTIRVSANDVHNNSFECMDTILHEGRHAYQDDVINGRIANAETEETKKAWAHDDTYGCYISSSEGDYCDYYYQPQEADAYGFAKDQMDNMSTIFGDDPQYQDYIINRNYNDDMAKAEGMQKYGANNEESIKDAVREKVEDRYQAQQKQIINKPVNNNSQELSSRFETGRVDGRYLTGTENADLFNEYNNRYNNKELEFHGFPQSQQPIVMTNSGNVHGVDTWGDSEENFWNHHGNTHDDYKEIASHIPEVQNRLNAGESIESIRQDPNLKNCADAYFNENNMPEAVKYGNTYIHNDDGRHRILAAQEYGYDMPIKVVGEYTGKGESADPSSYNNTYDIKHDNNPYESPDKNKDLINGKAEETNQSLDFETKQQAIDDKYNKQLEDANNKYNDKVHTADENYNSKADRINNAPLTEKEKEHANSKNIAENYDDKRDANHERLKEKDDIADRRHDEKQNNIDEQYKNDVAQNYDTHQKEQDKINQDYAEKDKAIDDKYDSKENDLKDRTNKDLSSELESDENKAKFSQNKAEHDENVNNINTEYDKNADNIKGEYADYKNNIEKQNEMNGRLSENEEGRKTALEKEDANYRDKDKGVVNDTEAMKNYNEEHNKNEADWKNEKAENAQECSDRMKDNDKNLEKNNEEAKNLHDSRTTENDANLTKEKQNNAEEANKAKEENVADREAKQQQNKPAEQTKPQERETPKEEQNQSSAQQPQQTSPQENKSQPESPPPTKTNGQGQGM